LASRLQALTLQIHLKLKALTDPVTGLLNRSGFFQALEEVAGHSPQRSNVSAPWTIGFSGGLVLVSSQNGLPIERWIQQADAALYRAKNQGKGRIIVHLAGIDPASGKP
jgi:GGDEF domain-containing protein